MDKEQYKEPEMEIIRFEEEADIITTSGDDSNFKFTGSGFQTIIF